MVNGRWSPPGSRRPPPAASLLSPPARRLVQTRPGLSPSPGFGVGVVTATELGADNRFASLQLEGIRLKSVELLVCMKQTRSARVTSAFMESVATSLAGS